MADFDDDDIDRFLLGELAPDAPQYGRILDDFVNNPTGIVASAIRRWSLEAIEQADIRLDSIWKHAMSLPEDANDWPEPVVNETPEALQFGDYWMMDAFDLVAELSRFDDDLAVHRGSTHPLDPYREMLRQFVMQQWKWPDKRSLPEFQDEQHAARSLSAAITEAQLPLPFPPDLVATILVKDGLDQWCD